MKIVDAIKQGARSVRRPEWNSSAKLELPPLVNSSLGLGKCFGPWCKLHDSGTTTDILIFHADDLKDDWEIVEGAKNE